MIADKRRLLVLTSLEESWGDSEKIVFLGEWCKLYERRHVWGTRPHETVRFHWDDRNKLKRDYFYLESFHHLLLGAIADSLNGFHNVDYSVRYWQILLDPWLLSYIAVLFDRWESLRIISETSEDLEIIYLKRLDAFAIPFSYSEFIEAVISDEWNQHVYQRIIKAEYPNRFEVRQCDYSGVAQRYEDCKAAQRLSRGGGVGAHVISIVDRFLGKFINKYDVVFLESSFSLSALIRLNLVLGQVPRLFVDQFRPNTEEGALSIPEVAFAGRYSLDLKLDPQSPFEQFIKKWVVKDLPSSLIEHYTGLRDRAGFLPIQAKVIVTAGAHWANVFAKFWFAEQVRNGAKLIIAEHGGSLPSYREFFDFETDIADERISWFVPYHPKHTQLPPARLVGRLNKGLVSSFHRSSNGRYCSVIGSEVPRWVHRVHFYPMAQQCMTSLDYVFTLIEHLDEQVRKLIRVKPYPRDYGWSTRKRYVDLLGSEKVLSELNLYRVFSLSRLVVCTYPETTFSQAMASGIPVVLMYPNELNELNPIAFPLVEKLKAVKIVFHNPKSTAMHINAIWNDPECWWSSPEVLETRKEFSRTACDLDSGWQEKWKTFLTGVLA